MRFSLPKIRTEVKSRPSERRYELAAYQMATALAISLEDAQGWVDAAKRRARGIRE